MLFNSFQPSVTFIEEILSKTNDWFLYETQHWFEIGQLALPGLNHASIKGQNIWVLEVIVLS